MHPERNVKKTKEIPILILVSAIMLFQSCDPIKTIAIKAANQPNVSVAIYANPHFLTQSKGKEKLMLKMPNANTGKRDTVLHIGIGNWSEDVVKEFSKSIDSIIIVNSNGKILLKNHSDISSYLITHRHGFAKRRITIEAK